MRNPLNGVALFAQIVQHRQHAGRHVEADGIAGAARRAWIVRDEDGELALGARRLLQADEGRDAVRHLRHAIRFRPVGEGAVTKRRIGLALALEGNRAGKDAAVQFGQHDMHGEVGGRQATLVVLPDVAAGGGDDDLEHRHAGAVEQGFDAGFGAGGESGRGDDGGGFQRGERGLHERQRCRVFQAGDEDRDRAHAALPQRFEKGIDGRDIGGEQHRAIEQDGHDVSLPLEGKG